MTGTNGLFNISHRHYWLFVFVLLVSATLRLLNISYTGYWIDEMSSIHFATNQHWPAIFWDNSPGLYNLILKIWIFVFGDQEPATRGLSVLFSIVTTAVWLRFGHYKAGRNGALLLGGTHAVLSFSIYFAREARMYSLFELASTLLFVGVILKMDGRKILPKWVVGAAVLVLLTHYLAVAPIFLSAAFVIYYSRPDVKFKRIVICVAALSVLALFLIRFQSLDWQKLKFAYEPDSRWPLEISRVLFGGFAGALAILGLTIFGLTKKDKAAQMLTAAVALAFFSAASVGFLLERSLFLPRYFVFLCPLVVLSFLPLAHLQLKRFTRLQYLQVLLFSVFVLSQLWTYAENFKRENPPWREAAQILAQEKNVIVFTSRPLSLRSPYFDRYKINLQKFTSQAGPSLGDMVGLARVGGNVWILENFLGATGYLATLDQLAVANGCRLRDSSVRNSNPDWIVLIKIDCGS